MRKTKVKEALAILKAFGLPREQQNERSALSLLALVHLSPDKEWHEAEAPLMGITPIMDWMKATYRKKYMPNTRETIRRQTMHQFVSAGIARYNPDDPSRAVNSPHAVYQISPPALSTLVAYNTLGWDAKLKDFLSTQTKLVDQYAKPRLMKKVPISVCSGSIHLSPGKHSHLIKAIVEDFAGYFVPEAKLVYVGDTGKKQGYTDKCLLKQLGIQLNEHGKMPDVILYCPVRNWLVLVEAVTSHGPVDGKRHQELSDLFAGSTTGIVYVTAFPSRSVMSQYIGSIAWETEVWVADAPTHLIHFNGTRFLGPYK
jgi:hypothetical protein